jgi:hypothetical protein
LLIQAESGSEADSPLISAVIVNRLHDKMPLQIDATLCYAKGGCPPVPVDADKKIDSPYNTYKLMGLPPTPIETVNANALAAALNPAFVPYKYYVSDKNGKTYFATTRPSTNATSRRHAVPADDSPGNGVVCSIGSSPVQSNTRSLHGKQLRRGRTSRMRPLLGVASLVLEGGGNHKRPSQLLHDAFEDTPATPKQIRKRFGRKVAHRRRVHQDRSVRRPRKKRPRNAATWRAEVALSSTRSECIGLGACVRAARARTARTTLTDLRRYGPETWGRFNAGAVDEAWYYRSLSIVLSRRPSAQRRAPRQRASWRRSPAGGRRRRPQPGR